MTLKVADLFCGTGGFSYGFAQVGQFEVVFGVDIKSSSVKTFSANHQHAYAVCQDIRQIRVREIAEKLGVGPGGIDVVIAGPPCQGFSSIRPYRSINEDDQRNNLFEQLTIFVDFFRPRFVVFENVVGLFHHKGGQILEGIKQAFEALGYSVNVDVLSAVSFGVPQKRERVILLARRGTRKSSFPLPTHHYNGRSMAGRLSSAPPLLFTSDLPLAVTVAEAISDLPPIEAGEASTEYLSDVKLTDYEQERRKNSATLTLHSATKHTPRMLEIIRQAGTNRWALPDGLTTSGFSTCYSRLDADEPSSTITVNFVHPASNRCIHPTQNRALTPREGARLQSFDDNFKFCGSRTEIVKQIGEAVPPLLGKALAYAVLEQWE
ncbi:MAG TPA: DNA cytosine methyltransferase [Ktedonobacteraceae bacterium]|nr:DNA cytosine methyltransferase [Ktedonobacteraceae bacterium]